jgi:Cu(I)/Ag(I) efflux system membrane fusion protein
MKKNIILSLFSFLILLFAACSTGTTNQEVKGKSMMMKPSTDSMSIKTNMHEFYTCTMHPQIIEAKPGKCPICGMDLVKKQADSSHNMTHMGNDSLKH